MRALPKAKHSLHDIPSGIWMLGFVSMLMDVSSEMIHALLPVYLVTVLGTSMLTVGLIEGIAEATASITKVFSGALSDSLGKRKLLATLGYGLAALTKPIFPLAPTVGWLMAARFVDRIGKGIRGAPRDALIADIAPAHLRGASFGLRQSLDTAGAVLGPVAAIGIMWLTSDRIIAVFWIAIIPAFLALALIALAVHEPARPRNLRDIHKPLSLVELRRLGPLFWGVLATGTLFSLARFSEAFLILRAQAVGLPITLAPAVLVVMSVAYAFSAYPAGILSDTIDRILVLAIGLGFLVCADLFLALSENLAGVGLGIVLWGLHMGFTQGLLAALVADASPPELRGTAFGVFNMITGLALLAASIIAGVLWDSIGARMTFLTGAAFAALTLGGLAMSRRPPRKARRV